MRYLKRLVILLSMMVAVSAAAGNPARAQDTESPASAPASDVSAADQPAAPSGADEGRPKRKPGAKAADADTAPAPAEAPEPIHFGGPAARNHWLQTGVSVMPGTGYRLIARYNDHQYCADSSGVQGKPVCARRLPTFLDFQLAFGALARMDVIVDLRFGLEQDPATASTNTHQFALAPGLRFWLDQEVTLKFYTTLQFVYDYETYLPGTSTPNSDFGVRNANGLMLDLIRNVGIYLQFGETLGFRRWFRIDLDLGLGVQLRFP